MFDQLVIEVAEVASPNGCRQVWFVLTLKPPARVASGVEAGVCKSLPFTHDDIEDLAKARQLKSYDELVSHVPLL